MTWPLRRSLLLAPLLAASLASAPARAQVVLPEGVELPPEARAVLSDLHTMSVGLALWTARTLPGALGPALSGRVPGRRGAWTVRLLAEGGLLPGLDDAFADLPRLSVGDAVGGQTLGWAYVGLASRWAPAQGLEAEIGLRLLPPLELCGTAVLSPGAAPARSCVEVGTVLTHLAASWAAVPPTDGRPGLVLGASGRWVTGSLVVERQTFHEHTAPELTLRIAGQPAVSWSMVQLGTEAFLHWPFGRFRARAGGTLDLTAGAAEVDPRTELTATREGELPQTSPVTFADTRQAPPLLQLGLHAGLDVHVGGGFSVATTLGVTFLGLADPPSLAPDTRESAAAHPAAYLNRVTQRRLGPEALPFLQLSLAWSPEPPAAD